MPLGRQKAMVRVVSSSDDVVRVRYPSRVIPARPTLAWLLYKQQATAPAADETIEECGDGATRGYRLEYTTGQAIRYTTYSGAGGASVTSSNTLAGEDDVFFLVVAMHQGAVNRVVLNETQTSAVAAAMAAPTSADDRFLLSRAAQANPLFACAAAQCSLGQMAWLDVDTLYSTIRGAQRLLEGSGALSYIDWTRLVFASGNGQSAHFGDDVTGARVDVPAAAAAGTYVRADRTSDWSVA